MLCVWKIEDYIKSRLHFDPEKALFTHEGVPYMFFWLVCYATILRFLFVFTSFLSLWVTA